MITHQEVNEILKHDKETKENTIPGIIKNIEEDIKLLKQEERKELLINNDRLKREGFNSILSKLGDKRDSFHSMFLVGIQKIQAMIKTQLNFIEMLQNNR